MLEENFPYLNTILSNWAHFRQNQRQNFSASYFLMKFWFCGNGREKTHKFQEKNNRLPTVEKSSHLLLFEQKEDRHPKITFSEGNGIRT